MVYSIKDLIHGAFDNPNIAAKARENMIFPFWNFIVGSKIACHTHPYRLGKRYSKSYGFQFFLGAAAEFYERTDS